MIRYPIEATPPAPERAGATSALLSLAIVIAGVVALYFGREIFVPLALAGLLSLLLGPLVDFLRRVRVPNFPAVLVSVFLGFLVLAGVGWTVVWQGTELSERLPDYRRNLEDKLTILSHAPPGLSVIRRTNELVRGLNERMKQAAEPATDGGDPPVDQPAGEKPLPVTVHQPDATPMEIVTSVVGPILAPLATAGITVVFVVFILLRRDDLRLRVIRLANPRDVPRASAALSDAAARVSRYLLSQLLLNVAGSVPIVAGLWLIGLPNPLLWGLLAAMLRFVPYIGPVIGAFFPLVLAVSVEPGWTMFLGTLALFIGVEMVLAYVVEPWLYGASTGLTPFAVIAAAVFWTWLWGPIGLVLSTPLTVCLVVLGRHLPQLAFLDVLFGSEPERLIEDRLRDHLAAGHLDDALQLAEDYVQDHSLEEFYDRVALPALAEDDSPQGPLGPERVTAAATVLVDTLSDSYVPHSDEDEPTTARTVICIGVRGTADEAAARMLRGLLMQHGIRCQAVSYEAFREGRHRENGTPTIVVLSYVRPRTWVHSRFLSRQVRRLMPKARLVIGLWNFPAEELEGFELGKITGADRMVTSLADAKADIVEVVTRATTEAHAKPAERLTIVNTNA